MVDNKYKGTVRLTSGITQRGDNNFPLVNAPDIQVDDEGTRLDAKLQELKEDIQHLDEKSGGITFTPHMSEDGVLTWTNNGTLDNPDPVTIKGADGKDGLPGERGPAGPAGAVFSEVTLTDGAAEVDVIAKYRVKQPFIGVDVRATAALPYDINGIMSGATLDDKTYLFGAPFAEKGTFNTIINTKYISVYDHVSGTLTQLPVELPSSDKGYHVTGDIIDRTLYLFGGGGVTNTDDSILAINLDDYTLDTLTITGSAPHYTGCAAVGTKIYLFGGEGLDVRPSVRVFDSVQKTFETLEGVTMPLARQYMVQAVAVEKNIYVFTQVSGGNSYIYLFDTETTTFTELSAKENSDALLDNLSTSALTIYNNKLYAFGCYKNGSELPRDVIHRISYNDISTSMSFVSGGKYQQLPIELYDEYCEHFDFEIVGYKLSEDGKSLYLSYYLNNERDLITLTADSFDLTDCKLSITGAERLLKYNTTVSSNESGSLNTEEWTFELEDGTTVTKKVVVV